MSITYSYCQLRCKRAFNAVETSRMPCSVFCPCHRQGPRGEVRFGKCGCLRPRSELFLRSPTVSRFRACQPSPIAMNTFLILMIFLLWFIVLLLAWFAISSCLGDEIRAQWSGRARNAIPTTFGLQYARVMGHGGNQAGWEQIEMEDMLDKHEEHRR